MKTNKRLVYSFYDWILEEVYELLWPILQANLKLNLSDTVKFSSVFRFSMTDVKIVKFGLLD